MSGKRSQPEYPEKYYAQLLFFAKSDLEWAKSKAVAIASEIYNLVESKIRLLEERGPIAPSQ